MEKLTEQCHLCRTWMDLSLDSSSGFPRSCVRCNTSSRYTPKLAVTNRPFMSNTLARPSVSSPTGDLGVLCLQPVFQLFRRHVDRLVEVARSYVSSASFVCRCGTYSITSFSLLTILIILERGLCLRLQTWKSTWRLTGAYKYCIPK
jgi:hypothetical protein